MNITPLNINNNRIKSENISSKLRKITYFLVLALTPFSLLPIGTVKAESISEINAKINNLNNLINQKRSQTSSLENEVAIIDAQVQQIQLQLTATEQEINTLNREITDTNSRIIKVTARLKKQQERLKEYLRVIYEEGQVSMVELLARSDSFSDFVDQREYLTSVQSEIKDSADKIDALKKELEAKRKELKEKKKKAEALRASQVAQKQAQVAQKNYKNQLLAQARNQAQSLQNQLNDLHAKKAALSASYGEVIYRSSTSYPYGNPPARGIIDTPDPWGYLIGECTSYVAWKRTTIGKPVPQGLGNANTWGYRAAGMGLSVSSYPRPGDVMLMPYFGGYGHVAFVEAVYGNGTVLISEYNWVPFSYSTRVVNPWNYGAQFIH